MYIDFSLMMENNMPLICIPKHTIRSIIIQEHANVTATIYVLKTYFRPLPYEYKLGTYKMYYFILTWVHKRDAKETFNIHNKE